MNDKTENGTENRFEKTEPLRLSGALALYGSMKITNLQRLSSKELFDEITADWDDISKSMLSEKTMDAFAMQFFSTGLKMGAIYGFDKIISKAFQLENGTSMNLEDYVDGKGEIPHTIADEIRCADLDTLADLLSHGDCDKCVARGHCNEMMLLEGKQCVDIVREALKKTKVAQSDAS